MRFRAANRTILLGTGIAAFVQGAGSIGESFGHAAVAVLGIALAVFAGWLQLPVPPPDGGPATPRSPDADGSPLIGQIAVTAFLALLGYFLVFLAGLVTVDYSAFPYESGVRPVTERGATSPGSPGPTLEWTLPPGARTVTAFHRADRGSPRETLLLGEFVVPSCGTVEWTLRTDGDRQLSRGTIERHGRQRFRIPLPDRDHATTLQLTLARADTRDCTAVFSSSPFWAADRPRIPLPGLATYIESTTR